jgi:glycosyltransferase involved in cell wall biosynthesis
MKIIFLTQYFPPEIGAPQNRIYEIAVRLKEKGSQVTILTGMPNYPKMKVEEQYRKKVYYYEEMNGLKVHRSYIYAKKSSSIILRLLNYFSFVFSSIIVGTFKLQKADYLICESPPLFLGISGWFLSRLTGAKFIFNVADLWPEMAEKLGIIKNPFILKITTVLEEFLYSKSYLITGQTQGIVKNISNRFPEKVVYWLKNGVDLDYYDPSKISSTWRKENNFTRDDFLLIYAGILGHAQGIEVILKAAKSLIIFDKIKFIIYGDGPEKDKLHDLKKSYNLTNVFFFPPEPKSKMPSILVEMNAAIIPLKKLDLFKGALPSKTFENLALEKPILLGVDGEAKDLFIEKGEAGLFFEPENGEDLSEKILNLYSSKELILKLGKNGRAFVFDYFNRDKIAADFHRLLLNDK